MTGDDSIFNRLFELFQSPGPVNWRLAAEVRKSLVGAAEPVDPTLADEYAELGRAVALRLEPLTPFPLGSPGPIQPVDRVVWASEDQEGFGYALEPLAGAFGGFATADPANPMAAMMAPMGPALLGMQAGTMVGFMAHRALGRFDTGLPVLGDDRLYLIVPNVEAFAGENDLDPRQVRLWAACHEVAHHAILAVPWVRPRIAELVGDFAATVRFDPSRITEALGRIDDPAALEGALGGREGVPGLLGSEHDTAKLEPVRALLATVEGFGIHLTGLALRDVVPSLPAVEEAWSRRRTDPDQAGELLGQLVGLTVERGHATTAAGFFAEIERRWSTDAVERVWSGPEAVPTVAELGDPVGWAARVLLGDAFGEEG